MNLNQDISTLLTTLGTAESRNTLFTNTVTQTALPELQVSAGKCQLTPEEEAASGATIELTALAEQILNYARDLQAAYQSVLHKKDAHPDWLKISGDYGVLIPRIYANLGSVDAAVQAKADALSGLTATQVQQLYTDWVDAKGRETLKKDAIEKVRCAVDLRALLIGLLRYLGWSGAEIAGLVTVV